MPLRPWAIPALVTASILTATAILTLTAPTAHTTPPPHSPTILIAR